MIKFRLVSWYCWISRSFFPVGLHVWKCGGKKFRQTTAVVEFSNNTDHHGIRTKHGVTSDFKLLPVAHFDVVAVRSHFTSFTYLLNSGYLATFSNVRESQKPAFFPLHGLCLALVLNAGDISWMAWYFTKWLDQSNWSPWHDFWIQTSSADKTWLSSQVASCQTWAGWACQGQLSWEEPQILPWHVESGATYKQIWAEKTASGDPYKQKGNNDIHPESLKGVARHSSKRRHIYVPTNIHIRILSLSSNYIWTCIAICSA